MASVVDMARGDVLKIEALGIDGICERIRSGRMLREICRELGVEDIGTLVSWLGGEDSRSARANEARRLAATMWDEMAMQVLQDASPGDISVAREIASHYRWRASKMAPKQYGDSSKIEHSGAVDLGFADALKAARARVIDDQL